MAEEYLSTDPNAGLEDQYISTDPNAGLEQKSEGGIVSNALAGAGDVIKGFAQQFVPDLSFKNLASVAYGPINAQITGYHALKSIVDTAEQVQKAEETPAFSRERFGAGLNVVSQLGLAALGARAPKIAEIAGLEKPVTPEAMPQTPEPLVSEVAAQETQPKPIEEVIPSATEIRQEPESSIIEHPTVEEGALPAETSGSNRPVESGEIPQEVAEPVPQPEQPTLNPEFSDIHDAARQAAKKDYQFSTIQTEPTTGPGAVGSEIRKQWDLAYKAEELNQLQRQQQDAYRGSSPLLSGEKEPIASGPPTIQERLKTAVASGKFSEGVPEEFFRRYAEFDSLPESKQKPYMSEYDPAAAYAGRMSAVTADGMSVLRAQAEGIAESKFKQPSQIPTITEPTTAGPLPKTEEVIPPTEPPPVPTEFATDNPPVSRFANRFVEERVKSGEIGEIAPGQGISTTELVQRGLQMPPERVNEAVSRLVQGGDIPVDDAAAIRGEEARLSQRSAQLSKVADADPSNIEAQKAANDAFKDLTDFHNGPVAQLKQNWHQQGKLMQGEIPVDLSTTNGLREQWLRDVGEMPPERMEPIFKKTAEKVNKSITEDNGSRANLRNEIDKATTRRKLPTVEEVQNSIMDRMKVEPCPT